MPDDNVPAFRIGDVVKFPAWDRQYRVLSISGNGTLYCKELTGGTSLSISAFKPDMQTLLVRLSQEAAHA